MGQLNPYSKHKQAAAGLPGLPKVTTGVVTITGTAEGDGVGSGPITAGHLGSPAVPASEAHSTDCRERCVPESHTPAVNSAMVAGQLIPYIKQKHAALAFPWTRTNRTANETAKTANAHGEYNFLIPIPHFVKPNNTTALSPT